VQTPKPRGQKDQGHPSRARKKGAPLARKELARINQEITDRFFGPPSEDETNVTVMVVDPYCVHVYWSIMDKDLARLRQRLKVNKQTQRVLRFYDLTDRTSPGPSHFDILVTAERNHRYVDLWADNKRYLVELGLRDRTGRFGALARSNIVETPRANPVEPVAPTVFVRRDIKPPVPVQTVPLEFSISIEERAAQTRQLMARYFPTFAEIAQTPSKTGCKSKPKPTSEWSANLPRSKP
jgi:uncharacterized protein